MISTLEQVAFMFFAVSAWLTIVFFITWVILHALL